MRRFSHGLVAHPQLLKSTQRCCCPRSLHHAAAHFASVSRPLHQAWAARTMRPWMCIKAECHHVNPSKSSDCETCGGPKPILVGWVCTACDTKNFKGVKTCKKCAAKPQPGVWSCAACHKNNAVDDLEDNSRCGHCGYDMAPLSKSEEEILRMSQERQMNLQAEQEQFDSISARDADDQLGSETGGFDPKRPPQWAANSFVAATDGPAPVATPPSAVPGTEAGPTTVISRKITVETIAPFKAKPVERATSIIGRKPRPTFNAAAAKVGPPGHDWMCRSPQCGTVNGGDDESCASCKSPFAACGWECLCCAAVNHQSRTACFNCTIPIPVSWACQSCRAMTSVFDKACRNCSAPRQPVEPKTPREATRMLTDSPRMPRPRRADWSCGSCHALNFASRTRCFKCDAEKPTAFGSDASAASSDWGSSSDSPPNIPAVGEGNWQCKKCSASNFRTRTDCWQCSAPASATQVGGWEVDSDAPRFEKEGFQGGEDVPLAPGQVKSWGGKSGEDWMCGKCFTKNFKGKTECFKCGAAKTTLAAPRAAFAKRTVKI